MLSTGTLLPLALLALPLSVLTHPTPRPHAHARRADAITDATILQYALTLEHLENAFYSGALARFSELDFLAAGLPPFARGRFAQIGQHEAGHVKFLETALGAAAVKPCTYSFPYTDPKSFAALAEVLEGVGTSAYLGAAALISDPGTLTAAGAILTTEARHEGWINSAVKKANPWSGSLETPLGLNLVYTLAAQFITACPPENAPLPVHAFPALAVQGAHGKAPAPGKEVSLVFEDGAEDGGPRFLALFTGLSTLFAPIEGKKATLPGTLQGTVYAVVSKSGTAVTDDSTVAGPAVLLFPFDSKASNP